MVQEWNNNVMFSNLGSATLDFMICPKPPKLTKIDQKVIRIDKNLKVALEKL